MKVASNRLARVCWRAAGICIIALFSVKMDAAAQAERGSIGDTVWLDLDGNGIQQHNDNGPSESGIPGVIITLTDGNGNTTLTATDEQGKYLFENLVPDSYTVQVDAMTLLPDLVQTYDAVGELDHTSRVTLTANLNDKRHHLDQDFGYQPLGSVGDLVWIDLNNDGFLSSGDAGLPYVAIYLYHSSGITYTTVTDLNGNYLIDALPYGNYTIQIDPTTLPPDVVQMSATVQPSKGVIDLRRPHSRVQDFGYELVGSIGNKVWLDLNNDNIQNLGEAGIADVLLTLTDSRNNVFTTTTDSEGHYLFQDLSLDTYVVRVENNTLAAGLTQTFDNDDTLDHTSTLTLTARHLHDRDQDFGYRLGLGTVGDRVWADYNSDGVQDRFETGLPDVTLILTNRSGQIMTTTTDANGNYLFTDIPLGEYTLAVDNKSLATYAPTCTPITCQPATVILDVNNPENLDQDFGYRPLPVGQIGDRVWLDLDGDGRQDADENGLSDVIVTLTDSSGNVYTTVTQSGVDTQSGHYRFDNLLYDRYIIAVDPTSLPPDLLQTFDDNGTLDHTSTILLDDQNPDDRAQDFGYRPTGSMGGTIWRDSNDNGIQDEDENSLSGVTVKLTTFQTPSPQPSILLTTTTDSNGSYLFDALPYATYRLEIDNANLPSFLVQTYDADGLLDHRSTASININRPHHLDQHFGYRTNIQPEIGLEKLTRMPGQTSLDADAPPGPMVPINSPLIWRYEVTNLGNVDLADIELDDDIEGQVTRLISGDQDNDTILDVGETWVYNLSGSAYVGQYENTATVTGQPIDSEANPLIDDAGLPFASSIATDTSHYFGVDASLRLESAINNIDTTNAPGPLVLAGSALTWSYTVINTGSVPLDNIKASNEQGLAIDCPQTRLASGETMTCIALDTASMGHTKIRSHVEGTPIDSDDIPIGPPAHAQTLNYYHGSFSAVQLEKSINGIDGDEAPGPSMQVGEQAVWYYTIRNLGNTPLADVNVSDDQGVVITAQESAPGVNMGDLNSNSLLDVSEVWRYTADVSIQPGQQGSLATVLATPTDENGTLLPSDAVRDEDANYYTGYVVDPQLDAGLTLDVAANGVADDFAPGLYVVSGMPVVWTYEVRNTTNQALREIILFDTQNNTIQAQERAPGINEGDVNQNGLLERDEVWQYISTSDIAQTGQHENVATAQAMPVDAEGVALATTPLQASNASHYFGAESAIELTYMAGDGSDDIAYAAETGDAVPYTFIVKNSGNVLLTDLEITDDNGTPDDDSDDRRITEDDCPGLALPLSPAPQGRVVQCTFTKIIAENATHTASVIGTPVDANGDLILALPVATANASASAQIAQPAIQLETTIYRGQDNGRGCERNEGEERAYTVVGEPVTYCFLVTNVGNVYLTHLHLTDDTLGMSIAISDTLAPGATTLLTLDSTALNDLVNNANVRGLPSTAAGLPTGALAVVDEDGAEVVIDIASIGNRVWHDLDGNGQQNRGEPGVAGIMATLINGDTGDGVLDVSGQPITTVTDGEGFYLFENLPPDTYAVEFDLATLPDGYTLTHLGEGNDSVDSDVSPENGRTTTTGILFGGDEYMGLDMGLIKPVRIQSRAWYDNDGNGTASNLEDEPGVAGLLVALYNDETEQPVLDAQGQPITDTTDSDGNYLFTGLWPGKYKIVFDLDTLPNGYRPNGESTFTTSFLNSGEQETTLDMGIIASVTIGDLVWVDHDGDGLQGPGEPGMAGLTLVLLDGNSGRPYLDQDGLPMATVTDRNGHYHFDDLPPGNYSVQLVLDTLPAGYALVAQNQGREDTRDSDANPMTGKSNPTGFLHSGEQRQALDIGLVLASEIQVGDRVWFDENGNGLQDHPALEPGIAGVAINLFHADGTPARDQSGNLVPAQVSDEEGHYLFTDLLPGDYYVKFDLTTIPEGYNVTAIHQGDVSDEQDALDSDVDPRTGRTPITAFLAPGKQDRTLDMGLTQPRFDLALDTKLGPGQPAIIRAGDDIRFTLTIHNQGDIAASQVTLVDYLPFGFNLSENRAQGWAMAENLATLTLSELRLEPGQSTTVDITLTAGNALDGPVMNYAEIASAQDGAGVLRADSDGTFNRINNEPADRLVRDGVVHTNFTDAENPDEDNHDVAAFAVEALASLGNRVWLDLNEDNIQGENEPGVANVMVRLYDATDAWIQTTFTDEDGDYLFTNLQPGEYYVIFTPPDGFEIINQGLDIAGDPSGFRSPFVSLESGERAEGGTANLLPNQPTGLPSVSEPGNQQVVFLPIIRL